jgi:hypothetical protein
LRARAVQAHAYTCSYGADLGAASAHARAALELAAEPPQDGTGPVDPGRPAGRTSCSPRSTSSATRPPAGNT